MAFFTGLLDGNFDDWIGKAHLDDAIDAHHVAYDIKSLYWVNYANSNRLYFMTERHPPGNPQRQRREVYYCLMIDTNNNGRFDDAVDRSVHVEYEPYHPGSHGFVNVIVMQGNNPRAAYSGFWGEHSDVGGRRAEWYATFPDLGIEPGQVIRMVLYSTDKQRFAEGGNKFPPTYAEWESYVDKRWADRLPDSGNLQWAPVPASALWMTIAYVGVAGASFAILVRRGLLRQVRGK